MGKTEGIVFGRQLRSALVLLITGLGLLFVFSGCRDQSAVESFSLECANPGSVALTEEPGVAAHREGLLLKRDGSGKSSENDLYSTPVYRLEKTLEAPEDSALFLSYRSDIPVRAHIGYGGREYGPVSLPSTNGAEAEAGLPLRDSSLSSFRISTQESVEEKVADEAVFELSGVRIAPRIDGAAQGRGHISFSAGMEGWQSLGYGAARLNFSPELIDDMHGRFSQRRVKIVYSYFPPAEEPPERTGEQGTPLRPHSILRLSGEPTATDVHNGSDGTEASRSFRMYVKRGNNTVYLYSRSLGFTPRSVEISLPAFAELEEEKSDALVGDFSVRSVTMEQVPMYAEESPEPLPADMGTVLRYDQNDWRRSDWELFSWSVFPRMLVFDFKNYAIQARFLKRLAFFVEKQGFTGELHSNEVIGELHGWNAHDYRAKDLAAFFDKAVRQNFPLNKEERILAQILVENGILRRQGEGYAAGRGGFISISRESSSRLRYLLLTHEGAHGLFFASEEYRDRISEIWRSLSDVEKRFWHRFLGWRNYNVDDRYLVENEFQAFLMQQHISHTDTYFKEYILPRYITVFPEHEEEMRRLLEKHPNHFVLSTRKVSDAARETAGVTAGDLLRLRPADPGKGHFTLSP